MKLGTPMVLACALATAQASTAWAGHRAPADLSRLVVVGDSLSAGHQSSCLREDRQVKGYASRIAEQAGVDLPLPLIEGPADGKVGFPPCLLLLDPQVPLVAREPGELGTRIDGTLAAWNLAVPGARAVDLLEAAPTNDFHRNFGFPYREMHGLVLAGHGPGKNVVEIAEELKPTTIILWIGSNDLLWSVIGGTADFVTPRAEFEAAFGETIERLAATGATLLVADIPDVTVAPFLIPAEEFAARFGKDLDSLGLAPGDFVIRLPASALLSLAESYNGPLPNNDVTECPIPGLIRCDVVLDAEDVAFIQRATRSFNRFLRRQARRHGAALVRTAALLNRVDRRGFDIRLGWYGDDDDDDDRKNVRTITTDYLGGAFSLDGLHPSDTGYAVLADLFIRVLNRRFRAGIPPLGNQGIAEIFLADPFNPDNIPGL